jgi:hypothetical protein
MEFENSNNQTPTVYRNPFQILKMEPVDILSSQIEAGKLYAQLLSTRQSLTCLLAENISPLPQHMDAYMIRPKKKERDIHKLMDSYGVKHETKTASIKENPEKNTPKKKSEAIYDHQKAKLLWVQAIEQAREEIQERENQVCSQHLLFANKWRTKAKEKKIQLPDAPLLQQETVREQQEDLHIMEYKVIPSISLALEWGEEVFVAIEEQLLSVGRKSKKKTMLLEMQKEVKSLIHAVNKLNIERRYWYTYRQTLILLRSKIVKQSEFVQEVKEKTMQIAMQYHPDRRQGQPSETARRRLQQALSARDKILEATPKELQRLEADLVFGTQVQQWSHFKIEAMEPWIKVLAPFFAQQQEEQGEYIPCETCMGEGRIKPLKTALFEETTFLEEIDICADCKGAGERYELVNTITQLFEAIIKQSDTR